MMMTRVKLMLLQEAILQEETMRKAGDWQQVKRIRYDPLECIWQHNKTLKVKLYSASRRTSS